MNYTQDRIIEMVQDLFRQVDKLKMENAQLRHEMDYIKEELYQHKYCEIVTPGLMMKHGNIDCFISNV